MRIKITMVLDAALVRQARSLAVRERKRLDQVLEEALADHLERKSVRPRAEVAARTAGSLKVPRYHVDRILREEPGILDA